MKKCEYDSKPFVLHFVGLLRPTRKDWIRTEVYISGKHASLFCQLTNNVSEYFIAQSPGQTEERQGQQETLESYTINFFTNVNKSVM